MNEKSQNNITFIDGFPYAVCLPHGGTKSRSEESEFSALMRGAGDRDMNCQMASWCSNTFNGTLFDEEEAVFWDAAGYVTQHDGKAENWSVDRPNKRSYGLGFRPVLVPLDKDTLKPDPSRFKGLADGSVVQLGTLYMNEKALLNPSEPVASPMPKMYERPELGFYPGDVPVYKHGASLRIGDTSKNPAEQIQFVVVDGKLVSDRVLLGCVSHDDLDIQFHLTKDVVLTQEDKHNETSLTADGLIPLWMRLGVSIAVTPDELEALRTEDNSAQEMLMTLLSSGRCRIDGDTYFPEDQSYLEEELNFDLPYMSFSAQSPDKERDKRSLANQIESASYRSGESSPAATTPTKGPAPEI